MTPRVLATHVILEQVNSLLWQLERLQCGVPSIVCLHSNILMKAQTNVHCSLDVPNLKCSIVPPELKELLLEVPQNVILCVRCNVSLFQKRTECKKMYFRDPSGMVVSSTDHLVCSKQIFFYFVQYSFYNCFSRLSNKIETFTKYKLLCFKELTEFFF